MKTRNTPKWLRFIKLSRADRALVLRSAWRLSLALVGLRLLGFRRVYMLIQRHSLGTGRATALSTPTARERAGKAVRAMCSVERNSPVKPNCLERSLALWWMLRLESAGAELHIGGRKNGERLEAHAWVELDGVVLNDSADVHYHYARFDAPIAAAEADFR